MSLYTVLLFCDVHVDKGATLNLLQKNSARVSFVDVESYRLTMLRHHWHWCVCSYSHNIITELRLAPSIPWLYCPFATIPSLLALCPSGRPILSG